MFGIRFRPAGFQPFLGAAVATLTDRRVPVAEIIGRAGDRLVADRDITRVAHVTARTGSVAARGG